jgi:hypothetical protein
MHGLWQNKGKKMDYPVTKQDWEAFLSEIEAQIEAQGRIVEARLLDKKRQIEKILADWD